MSRCHAKAGMATVIKDIYFTMFLLCRHLTYYDGEAGDNAASFLVSVVMIALGSAAFVWLDLLFDLPKAGRWTLAPLALIAWFNYRLFVFRHGGERYEDRFAEYSEAKQALLYLAALIAIVAIVVGAGFSLVTYRHAHGFTA